jgi:hypothetical protein
MASLVRLSRSALQCGRILVPGVALSLVACASNTPTATGSSGSGSGSSGSSSGSGGNGSGSSGGSSGSTSGSTSGSGGSSSGSSGVGILTIPASGSIAAATYDCNPPTGVDAGTLPLIVDSVYKPTGWMGDAYDYPAAAASGSSAAAAERTPRMQIFPVGYSSANNDACTPDVGNRSSSSAKGSCWKVVYTPFPKYCTALGWAGAFWQYPNNNWGAGNPANNASGTTIVQAGGFPIPQSSTGNAQVSFWARGALGGEKVRFFSSLGPTYPCQDYAQTVPLNETLTTTWKNYVIPLTGLTYATPSPSMLIAMQENAPNNYFGGVLGPFGFGVGDQLVLTDGGTVVPQPPADAGINCPAPQPQRATPDCPVPMACDTDSYYSNVIFYIDDIEWQQM